VGSLHDAFTVLRVVLTRHVNSVILLIVEELVAGSCSLIVLMETKVSVL